MAHNIIQTTTGLRCPSCTDLNVYTEVVKLLLSDTEEAEGEAGIQARDADPARVRDVITGVSVPLPDIPRHLGGVRVQVQHLIVNTPEKIQSVIRRATNNPKTAGKTKTLLEACFVHRIDLTQSQSQ